MGHGGGGDEQLNKYDYTEYYKIRYILKTTYRYPCNIVYEIVVKNYKVKSNETI